MFKSMLNLNNVQIVRVVETSDGMGGVTTSTTITTLSRASIWQAGAGDRYLSDKVTKASTHVLACLPGEYSFNVTDRQVLFNGETYKITGQADDVANRGEVKIVGLEWLK